MKLYIANCTKQIWNIFYRLPETTSARQGVIKPGEQIPISGDLSPEQVDNIIGQLSQYGLICSDEVDRAKPFNGICYSINKPVASSIIQKLFMHNQDILELRAEETLRNTALANNQLMESKLKEVALEANRPIPKVWEYETALSDESRTPAKDYFYKSGNKKATSIVISRSEDSVIKKGRSAQ